MINNKYKNKIKNLKKKNNKFNKECKPKENTHLINRTLTQALKIIIVLILNFLNKKTFHSQKIMKIWKKYLQINKIIFNLSKTSKKIVIAKRA